MKSPIKNLLGWNYVYTLGHNTKNDSVAEWSMALVLGTSLFGGKGSNPFTFIVSTFDSFRGLTIFNRSWPSIDVRPVSSVG